MIMPFREVIPLLTALDAMKDGSSHEFPISRRMYRFLSGVMYRKWMANRPVVRRKQRRR